MKGLLRRLAARAVGTTVPVRSDVRLPYGGGSLNPSDPFHSEIASDQSMTDDAGDAEVPPEPRGMTSVTAFEPAALDVRAARSIEASAADRLGVPHRAQSQNSSVGTKKDTQSFRGDASSSVKSGASWQDDAVSGPQRKDRHTAAPEQLLEANSLALTQGSRSTETVPDRGEAIAATRARPVPGHREMEPNQARDPKPLLAVREHASDYRTDAPLSVSGLRDQLQQAFASETQAGPAEVHVHIGRIEVTAVRDSPPAARRKKPSAIPMSLEAYLASRSRS